ncbi:ATP-binding cassette domain-containing protein [Patescibacteria group bacterium]|nr:ATP-binding cassette domain-containing protein [Patescibacteria group bacterium]
MKSIENIKFFFKKYLSSKIWLIVLVVFLIIISQLLSAVTPYLYKLIVDKLTEFIGGSIVKEALIQGLTVLVTLFFITGFLRLVFQGIRMYFINRLEAEVIRRVAGDFIKHVLNLSFHFHAHRKTGQLAKRFARGVKAVEEFMDAFVFNLFPNLLELSIIVAVYFIFDWQSGLILLAMIFLFAVVTIFFNNWQQKYREISNTIEDQANKKAIDALMNAEAVKYFAQEAYEAKTFNKFNLKWQLAQIKFWDKYIIIEFIQGVILVFGALAIIIFSINRVINQTFTIGSFVMMVTYLARVYFPLFAFQWVYRRLRTSVTDLESIMNYFSIENEIKDAPGAKNLSITEGRIEFKNVSFAYEEGKQVLRDVNFYVPAGKSIALVGPSGVGKSTLIKLLYRFYDLTKGRILIDNQDISQVKQESLRKNMVIVPQETALFNESIKYNIAYAKPSSAEADIKRAAGFSRIADFIRSLKNGYSTLVGERGIRLSGGEKQRVSIARAVLSQAPILILDEATSSLDSATEKEIQDSLENLMKDKTTIIIAHRLSTVMKADYIIVLEKGGVAQLGTHQQLLEKGGLYQKLWELQAGGYIR